MLDIIAILFNEYKVQHLTQKNEKTQILVKTRNMDFRTSIDLSTNDNQLVLASQEMGTFYCVYASFSPTGVADEYDITFELRNYKGPVNFKIKNVVPVSTWNTVKYLKVYTTISNVPTMTKTVTLTLKKDDLILCHRISPKGSELSDLLISEEEFTNFDDDRGDNKTPYEIEKELAEDLIDLVIESDGRPQQAASKYFCVIGFSQVI